MGRDEKLQLIVAIEQATDPTIITDLDGDVDSFLHFSEELKRKQLVVVVLDKNYATERLINSISSVLVTVGKDGRIICWNKTAEQVFGISAEEVIGRKFTECGIHWSAPDTAETITNACCTSSVPVRLDDLGFIGPDGRHRLVGITVTPMGGPERSNGEFLLLGADVTERKEKQAQESQARKLQAVGQMAAGIAHEINTPIQFIGDNTQFLHDAFDDLKMLLQQYNHLRERVQTGQPIDSLLRRIEETQETVDLEFLLEEVPTAIDQTMDGVRRVAKIVQAMKDFSRPDVDGRQMADLNRALESTLTITHNELKYVADVETDLDPDLPLVVCQVDEINQVFLNLLINARDAIADVVDKGAGQKGKITVTSHREGSEVIIAISDTGTGIPAEIQDRIFDPFFTTKEVGKGTGQGLSIAYSVVKKHGGSLTFETRSGQGTTFFIRLPIQSD